jgi:putative MATE family efflux protein
MEQNKPHIFDGLTEGPISNNILKLSIPMIFASSFDIIRNLIDAFFVGKLSSENLAAVSLAGVIIFFLVTFCIGLGVGSVALLSRAFGERNLDRADRIVAQSIYLGMFSALVIGIIGYYLSPIMLGFLGAKDKMLAEGDIFLKIMFIGIPTTFFMFQGSAIFQAAGDTVTPMKVGIITTILNIILCPILIFGWWFVPRLEVAGAALATVIAQTIGSIMMLYIFINHKHKLHIELKHWQVDYEIIKNILFIGVPSTIQMLLRSFAMLVLMKFVTRFGPEVIAVYGVGGRLFQVFLIPGFGFGNAAATMVGHNLGAGKPDRASQSMVTATLYYLAFLVFSGTLF